MGIRRELVSDEYGEGLSGESLNTLAGEAVLE